MGTHVSVAGGLHNAFANGLACGCSALQVFTKNANRWQARPIEAEQAVQFRKAWRESGIGPVIAHDAYLINLASPKDDVWNRSKAALRDELARCAQLGIDGLIMHPGAHLGSGVEPGIARIRAAFDELLPQAPSQVRILIENTAGQGSYLGGDFAHLAALLDGFDAARFGVCFDTCHAHAAGYDLSSAAGYAEVMADFDRRIGVERIAAFHLNDSLRECGSHVDRHTHIGEGTIGRAGFTALLRDRRFYQTAMILETPKGEGRDMDRVNLELLRSLAGESA
jgi:deoxyribonuclease-4